MARSYHGSILKIDMYRQMTCFFQWVQLKDAIPARWKKTNKKLVLVK